jgi:hypothetical protein
MPTWKELEQEERERERRYQESLGPLGRLIDNHWTYMLLLIVILPVCMGIGLLIGLIMSW